MNSSNRTRMTSRDADGAPMDHPFLKGGDMTPGNLHITKTETWPQPQDEIARPSNWIIHCNEIRAHNSLGYLTLNEFSGSPCGADSAPLLTCTPCSWRHGRI